MFLHAWSESLGRVLYATAVTLALLAGFPLAADASRAFLAADPGVLRLKYEDNLNNETNEALISRGTDGRYLVADLKSAMMATPTCESIDMNHVRCPPAGSPAVIVQAVLVTLNDGDDELTLADSAYPQQPLPLGVPPASATGGAGKDTLRGGSGPDIFQGGADDDPLIAGGGGDDSMSGDAGSDTLDGGAGAEGSISGDSGDDRVAGGPGNDRGVTGGAGNDTVDGGDGTDDVRGNEGMDKILGGAGHDLLDMPQRPGDDPTGGQDILEGGPGDDDINGGPSRTPQESDVLRGGDGTDTADFSERTSSLKIDLDGRGDDGESGEGDDVERDVERVIGGLDSDSLIGAGVANFLDGGAGDDRLNGRGGDDTLEGGRNSPGSDTLSGEDGRDTLSGGAGDDALEGGRDHDSLSGAGGGDELNGDTGNDALAGGPGGDALDGGDGNDELNGGETDLIGADGADILAGGPGADLLLGGDGNDELDGGSGPDRMSGEAGRDTVTYENRSSPVTVTLDGLPDDGEENEHDNVAPNVEAVRGGTVADTLRGDRDDNMLDGGDGDDLVRGDSGPDRLAGGNASDLARARDGDADIVACGDDDDLAIVDRRDTVRDCETVDHGGKRRLAVGSSALVRPTQSSFGLRLPGGSRFFRLEENVKIPIASTIDARADEVLVATARNRAGARQGMSVSDGAFSLRQGSGQRPVTVLRLSGGNLRACGKSSTRGKGAKAHKDKPRRRLRTRMKKGNGKGKVKGKYSSGAAEGTEWLTEDRCDGTLTRVVRGTVRVHDFVRQRTVTVRADESYLARAP